MAANFSLVISAILFSAYIINVVIGSQTGAPIVGDVAEMLVLFASTIAFVIAILQREARDKKEAE